MRAIIVHGTKGSPEGNWFKWLACQLEEMGIQADIPRMPTPENQSLLSWHSAFHKQSMTVEHDTILVGHSTGAVFVLRLLEQLQAPVFCSALVSPPMGEIGISEYDALNSSFFEAPFDWEKIRTNAGQTLLLMGDNDPYVPQQQLWQAANALKIEPIVVKNGGHLNSEAGFTSFPLLFDLLKSYLRDKNLPH